MNKYLLKNGTTSKIQFGKITWLSVEVVNNTLYSYNPVMEKELSSHKEGQRFSDHSTI